LPKLIVLLPSRRVRVIVLHPAAARLVCRPSPSNNWLCCTFYRIDSIAAAWAAAA
jgi:hypothetical protein